MKNVLEFHIIHPMATSCLNRDEFGNQKTIKIGGTLRTRVSSQSWKYAIRKAFQERYNTGIRTNKKGLIDIISNTLQENNFDMNSSEVTTIINQICSMYFPASKNKKAKKDTDENNNKNETSEKDNVIVFVSPQEIKDIVNFYATNKDAKKEQLKDIIEKIKYELDIALFGRLLTSGSVLDTMIDGSFYMAHAISVNRHENIDDFFTSNIDTEITHSTHINTRDCVAPILYRYFAIDLNQCLKNIHSEQIDMNALSYFIENAIFTMPVGLQHAMTSFTRPYYIRMNYYDNCKCLSQVAFEKSIDNIKIEDNKEISIAEQAKFKIQEELENNFKNYSSSKPIVCIEDNMDEIINFVKKLKF